MIGQGLALLDSGAPKFSMAPFYGSGGIKLHWDAAKGVTISTGVSNWVDQTGNGNTLAQGTGAQQPVLVTGATPAGTPAIHFDTTAKNINKTSGCTTQANAACTLFFVIRIVGNGTRIWSHDNAAGSGGSRLDSTSGNRVVFFWGTSGITDGAFDTSKYEVHCWRLAASGGYGTAITTKELYINGVLQSTPSGTPNMTQGTVEVSFGVNGTCPDFYVAEAAEAPDTQLPVATCQAIWQGQMAKHGIS